ncbi:MAG: hypothetical protein LBG27_00455 [Spirochaetaceae bacterium]|jgi:hypothetical protein|nr:hypothetical protein [Spirochaetaceae bacterium]
MNTSQLFNNFSGGETSPLLAARVDSAAYAMGAKKLRNFIPMMTGGVRKRPGTWLYKADASDKKTRLVEWDTGLAGENARLLLVFAAVSETETGIDVYREAGLAGRLTLSGVGEAGLFELQYAVTSEAGSSALWLVHRNIAPRTMTATEETIPETLDTPAFFDDSKPVFDAPGKYPGAAAVYAGRLCLGGNGRVSKPDMAEPPSRQRHRTKQVS